jgi:hypothetical protein
MIRVSGIGGLSDPLRQCESEMESDASDFISRAGPSFGLVLSAHYSFEKLPSWRHQLSCDQRHRHQIRAMS